MGSYRCEPTGSKNVNNLMDLIEQGWNTIKTIPKYSWESPKVCINIYWYKIVRSVAYLLRNIQCHYTQMHGEALVIPIKYLYLAWMCCNYWCFGLDETDHMWFISPTEK